MIGLRLSDQEKYEAFISGKDATPAYDILLTENMIDSVLSILLEPNEVFSKQSYMYNENKKIVSAKDRLTKAYEALFLTSEAENPLWNKCWGNKNSTRGTRHHNECRELAFRVRVVRISTFSRKRYIRRPTRVQRKSLALSTYSLFYRFICNPSADLSNNRLCLHVP